jgi:hypothetical protein
MAHKFDRDSIDPYGRAAEEISQNLDQSDGNVEADAGQQLFDDLGDAIVTALGDIAATAYRLGVNDPNRLRGLARTVSALSEEVLLAYAGDVDAEPALQALASDPRMERLGPENRMQLERQIEGTRQLEQQLMQARRLPQLLNLAGGLGLYVPDEVMEGGELLLGRHPTPTADR